MSNILAVYDFGDSVADRYTVITDEPDYSYGRETVGHMALSLSHDCDMPNGFSQWCSVLPGAYLGIQIRFDDLPERVQKHALERLA